jgi:very-short-patch-repair endonuclease
VRRSEEDFPNVARRDRVPGAIHTSQRSEKAARRRRRQPTFNEKRLWDALRQMEVADAHFRRQVPFGPYIADFVSHRARLIIEVDGGVHDLPDVALRDASRDDWLIARGYLVHRVTNRQIEADIDAVIRDISQLLTSGSRRPASAPILQET